MCINKLIQHKKKNKKNCGKASQQLEVHIVVKRLRKQGNI
jgi:hypothetical protein